MLGLREDGGDHRSQLGGIGGRREFFILLAFDGFESPEQHIAQ